MLMRTILVLSLCFLLSSCSLSGKAEPVEYFTLSKVKNSCIRLFDISGPAYLLTEKIVVKRPPHRVGSISGYYWISPLGSLLREVLTDRSADRELTLLVEDLSFNADSGMVVLKAAANRCFMVECEQSFFSIEQPVTARNAIDIVSAYQAVFEEVVKDVCPQN